MVTYGYDAVGNRVHETEKDSAGAILAEKQGVFDNLNRLTELTDLVTPAEQHELHLGPKRKSDNKDRRHGDNAVTTDYVYDLRDKLVEVVQGASTLGRFQYDSEGRRTKKIGEEGLRQYVYDQTSLLAEYDAAGLPKAKYDYGSDRLISLTRADEGRRYFSLDGLRSVVNLTDDAGSTVASYHLDTWGNFRFPTELDPLRQPLRLHRPHLRHRDRPLQRKGPLLRSQARDDSSPRTRSWEPKTSRRASIATSTRTRIR